MATPGFLVVLVGALGILVVIKPLIPLVVLLAGIAFLCFARQPRACLIVWLLGITFVPYWVGVNAAGYLPVVSVIGVAILLANAYNGHWKMSKADLPIIILIAVGFIAVSVGNSNQGVWLSMMTQWLVAYLVGKTTVPAAGLNFSIRAAAVIFGLVGMMAVIELSFAWHPFRDIVMANRPYETWSPIQVRGGVERSEWAMGHSIALGGVLVASIPFILGSSLRGVKKVILLVAVLAGISCTFSRAAILAAALTLVLSLLFMPGIKRGARAAMLLFIIVACYFGVRFLVPVFEEASLETAGSSSYRARMLAELIPQLSYAGRSTAALESADGSVYYGSFQSIDSTFLSIGLGFGWVSALALMLPFFFMVMRLFRRTATFGEIALLGQLPLLFTVALITQYQIALWFIAGVAAAEWMVRNGERSGGAESRGKALLPAS